SALQIRAVPSALAVSRRRPSGLNDAAEIRPACCRGGLAGSPFVVFHRRALPSLLPVSTRRPSGLKATVPTDPLGLRSTTGTPPMLASHTRVSVYCAVTTREPSALNAAAPIPPSSPSGGPALRGRSSPLAASQI